MPIEAYGEIRDLATLQWLIERRFDGRVIEVSPQADGAEFKPLEGWFTIRIGGGGTDCGPGTMNTWLRVFHRHAENRAGALYWREVLHFDREKRELIGVFCIQ